LQRYYNQNFAQANDDSEPFRQIHVLIAAHDWFQLLEGQHSTRVHEVIDRLLCRNCAGHCVDGINAPALKHKTTRGFSMNQERRTALAAAIC
jgi:hypothetical protein